MLDAEEVSVGDSVPVKLGVPDSDAEADAVKEGVIDGVELTVFDPERVEETDSDAVELADGVADVEQEGDTEGD